MQLLFYRKDRGSRGGGVLVAVDESIPSSLIDSPPNLEIIVVQLGLTYPIVWCTVYIPPNSSDLFETLIPFLTDILSSNTPCFIVPDICWSTLSGCSSLSSYFCDFVFDCNLTQHNLEPHIKGNTLDLVFTNNNISIWVFLPGTESLAYQTCLAMLFSLHISGWVSSQGSTCELGNWSVLGGPNQHD